MCFWVFSSSFSVYRRILLSASIRKISNGRDNAKCRCRQDVRKCASRILCLFYIYSNTQTLPHHTRKNKKGILKFFLHFQRKGLSTDKNSKWLKCDHNSWWCVSVKWMFFTSIHLPILIIKQHSLFFITGLRKTLFCGTKKRENICAVIYCF